LKLREGEGDEEDDDVLRMNWWWRWRSCGLSWVEMEEMIIMDDWWCYLWWRGRRGV